MTIQPPNIPLATGAIPNHADNYNNLVNYLNNLASYFALRGGSNVTRIIASGATDSASATDQFIGWNSATASAKTQNIPASSGSGQRIEIKDIAGTAGTYAITITPASGTIDGASTYVLSSGQQSATILDTSVEWVLV